MSPSCARSAFMSRDEKPEPPTTTLNSATAMRSSSVRAMPSWPTTIRVCPRSGRSTTVIARCAGARAGGGGPGSTSAPFGHAPKRSRSAAITACASMSPVTLTVAPVGTNSFA